MNRRFWIAKTYILIVVLLLCMCSLVGCSEQQISEKPTSVPSQTPNETASIPSQTAQTDDSPYSQSPWFDNHPVDSQGVPYPPVSERLPAEPLVVDAPRFETGKYTVEIGVDLLPTNFMRESFLIEDADYPGVYAGNIFASLEADESYKIFNIHLRKGLRWSDSTPVTAEDIRFAIEDCWGNEEFYPQAMWMWTRSKAQMPLWCQKRDSTAGEMAQKRGLPEVKVLDEYEVQLIYTESRADLASIFATRDDFYLLMPSAFLKQFHLDYTNPEDITLYTMVYYPESQSRPSLPTWEVLNDVVSQPWVPTLAAWMTTTKPDTVVRNPYYFKIDREGQQLPYIDTLLTADYTKKVYAPPNRLHFTAEYSHSMEPQGNQVETARAKAAEKNQVVYDNFIMDGSFGGMRFLTDSYDPWWCEMVKNPAFRQALCYAVDTETLTPLVAGSSGYILSGWEYDLEKARQLMNQAMPELDKEGFRCWNGERVTLKIGHLPINANPLNELSVALAETYKASYEALGFECKTDVADVWDSLEGALRVHIYPGFAVLATEKVATPASMGAFYSIDPVGYDWWISEGKSGIEPLPETKALFQRIDDYQKNPNIPPLEMYQELLQTMRDDALGYPGVFGIPSPIIADANLANIPKETVIFLRAWASLEMWFMK